MQGVGHGVGGLDDEAHFAVLFVFGAQILVAGAGPRPGGACVRARGGACVRARGGATAGGRRRGRRGVEGAVEAVLPELGEPRIAAARGRVRLQAQVLLVERGHARRVDADGDAALGLGLVAAHHVQPVGPAVAAPVRYNNKTRSISPES